MGTAALSERDYVERPDWSSTRSAPLVMLGAAASRSAPRRRFVGLRQASVLLRHGCRDFTNAILIAPHRPGKSASPCGKVHRQCV